MDPHGYLRLGRALDFLVIEVRAAGVDSSKLEWARRFAGGSPSEYLGESLIAIDALLRERSRLADVVAQFAEGTAAEIGKASIATDGSPAEVAWIVVALFRWPLAIGSDIRLCCCHVA